MHILTCVLLAFAALATLKPQAGLVAPQVAPASQPAAVVSVHLDFYLMSCQASCVWLIDFCLFVCLLLRVRVVSPWKSMNRWE